MYIFKQNLALGRTPALRPRAILVTSEFGNYVVQHILSENYSEVEEKYVVRPAYHEGAEVLVYTDSAHLHSAPDRIYRDAIWRFM